MAKTTESPRAGEGPTGERRDELQLGLRSMSCSFCTSTVEKAYRRVPGVDGVTITLSHQDGPATYPERLTPTQLLAQRRRPAQPDGAANEHADERLTGAGTAGSASSTRGGRLVISVADHCERCAARIQDGLSHTKARLHGSVDVDTKTVRLRLGPEQLTVEDAEERLRDLGYRREGATRR